MGQNSRHPSEQSDWWRDAAIYQVYPRSFADGNGDGVGDIAGLRDRLPYLARLGVDAIWINPWYPSPLADGGYDVADYRDVEPLYGTLPEADLVIAEAHEAGIRVLLDIVHQPPQATAADLNEIRRRIDSAGLLFKLRVMTNELEHRLEQPSSTGARTPTPTIG